MSVHIPRRLVESCAAVPERVAWLDELPARVDQLGRRWSLSVGEPAYDATQHLLNCKARVHADPEGTVTRFAELLDVDPERVRLWLFARVAAEPRDSWDADAVALARLLRR